MKLVQANEKKHADETVARLKELIASYESEVEKVTNAPTVYNAEEMKKDTEVVVGGVTTPVSKGQYVLTAQDGRTVIISASDAMDEDVWVAVE